MLLFQCDLKQIWCKRTNL